MTASTTNHVAILGCGVIGLSTALAILEGQLEGGRAGKTVVTIVSKEVPDLGGEKRKKHSAEFASVWAGAHHVSDAQSERELRHDKITFERMSKLVRERPWAKTAQTSTAAVLPLPSTSAQSSTIARQAAEPLVWVHQTELFEPSGKPASTARPPYKGVLDWYPDFKPIPTSSLANNIGWGCTFSTLDIHVPLYHSWLLKRFLSLGGRLVIGEARSLSHAVSLATSPAPSSTICRNAAFPTGLRPSVLVASPGLGARFVQGIEDEAVHPQRGQVVIVRAPWLSAAAPRWESKPRYDLPGYSVVRPQGGREIYIIPRGDGTVVCGGTRIVDDWNGSPRPETTTRILQRCLQLVPQLADPARRTDLARPRVEDVDVVSVGVGLRPARRGGVRLERAKADVDGVKIVFNYGYGGAGYQASWGAALDAKELVEEALQEAAASMPSKL